MCEETDVQNLLVCPTCIDRNFDRHYSQVNAAWCVQTCTSHADRSHMHLHSHTHSLTFLSCPFLMHTRTPTHSHSSLASLSLMHTRTHTHSLTSRPSLRSVQGLKYITGAIA